MMKSQRARLTPEWRTILRTATLACATASALAAGACKRSGETEKPKAAAPAVPVTLTDVQTRPIQRWVDVTGTLEGEEDVTISNKVSGRVIAIYKDIGDRARPGEPLAQLLPNDYQRTVNLKRSALNEVLAKLGVSEIPGADYDVSKLPIVRKAKLSADNAREKRDRGKQLFASQPPLISAQDFEDLTMTFETSQSGYEAELLTARALATNAQTAAADLAIAEQALRDTTVRAPRPFTAGVSIGGEEGTADTAVVAPTSQPTTQPAGNPIPASSPAAPEGDETFVVAGRYVSVGELHSAISRMFRLVDDDPLKLRAKVPERFAPQIQISQDVSLSVDAYPNVSFQGTVSRINPQIDPENRTFDIEVKVPNADHRLRPGAFAKARVMTRRDAGVVFVPLESVVTFAGVNKVFGVADGKAVEMAVELGERQGDWVEVVKGVKPDQRVVVSGTSKLATGVQVAPAAQPAATSQPSQTASAASSN